MEPILCLYLNKGEEKELVEFLLNCSSMGYGKTREVLRIVQSMGQRKEVNAEGISDGWWYRFCQRWPTVSLRKGDPFFHARTVMTNREVLKSTSSSSRVCWKSMRRVPNNLPAQLWEQDPDNCFGMC